MTENGMKQRKVYHVTDILQTCYRESKFKPHDVRFKCPFKFTEITDLCFNCKWFLNTPQTTFQASGKESETVGKFVKNFMSTEILPHEEAVKREVPRVEIDIRDRK